MIKIGNSWDEILLDEIKKDYFKDIMKIIEKDYKEKVCYPPKEQIFNALKLTPYEDVKAVILGQDPYHGKNQANGLAFSVNSGVDLPPSLQNIYKEIENDLKIKMRDDGNLEYLAKQGVLLLNTALTVIEKSPTSHSNIGWEKFTDFIIETFNYSERPICFLLWGKKAKQKEKLITNERHLVLKASHPSPFSARLSFFGSRHFSKLNRFLEITEQEKIDFQN